MDKDLNSTKPIVTVLMPVKDGAAYLSEAVNSILSQTFIFFELLILNNGSNDGTLEILSQVADNRVTIVHNPRNISLENALNSGIKIAKGKYIARMDADDISLPTRLEQQVNFLEANPSIVLCGAWFEIFGTRNEVICHPETALEIKAAMLVKNPLCHPLVMFRKDVLINNGYSYQNDFHACEDYHLWATLSLNYAMYNIPEVLLRYRQHNSQVSTEKTKLQWANSSKVRQFLLNNLGVTYTDSEISNYEKVLKGDLNYDLDFDEALRFIHKILKSNEAKESYNQEMLIRTFEPFWGKLMLNYPKPTLKHYLYFRNSYFYPYFSFKKSKHLRFFIKCLFQ